MIAIIVACVAPYRTLFIRDRNPSPETFHPRLSFKAKAFKLFTSTERGSERERGEEDTWATTELPYLAPWPDSKEYAPDTTTLDNTDQGSKGLPEPSRCDEPWLTAEMPHLEPWYENGTRERACELQDAESLSPISTAHLRSHHTFL